MGARTSAEMLRALKLHAAGLSVLDASRKTGIHPSSIHQAIAKIKAKLRQQNETISSIKSTT